MKQKLLYSLVGLLVGVALMGLWRSGTFVEPVPSPVYDRIAAIYPELSQHDLAVIRESARRAHVSPALVVETIIRHPVVPNGNGVDWLEFNLSTEDFNKEMARFARIDAIEKYMGWHPGTARKLRQLSAEDFKIDMANLNLLCSTSP